MSTTNYTTLVQLEEQAKKVGHDNFIKSEVSSFKEYEALFSDQLTRREIFIYWLQLHQLRTVDEIAEMYGKSSKSWAHYQAKAGKQIVKGGVR